MEVSSDIASYNEYLEVVWRLAVEADQEVRLGIPEHASVPGPLGFVTAQAQLTNFKRVVEGWDADIVPFKSSLLKVFDNIRIMKENIATEASRATQTSHASARIEENSESAEKGLESSDETESNNP